eukprot:1159012-Pelagomonas_calceolata.AAC.4
MQDCNIWTPRSPSNLQDLAESWQSRVRLCRRPSVLAETGCQDDTRRSLYFTAPGTHPAMQALGQHRTPHPPPCAVHLHELLPLVAKLRDRPLWSSNSEPGARISEVPDP